LKPALAAAVGAERFLEEIRVTANLHHLHLLPLFDSGEADRLLYYVMPYVAGESLRARLAREGPLPVEEAVRVTILVAGAVPAAGRIT
jgi:eukaryotic-like serine/threonine-protein kinase